MFLKPLRSFFSYLKLLVLFYFEMSESVDEGARERYRVLFLEKLEESIKNKTDHLNVVMKNAYDFLIEEVEKAKSTKNKITLQYRRVSRFDVLVIGDTKRLVARGEKVKYFLPMEEIFDVIESSHISIGHGGRDRMKQEISKKYANITIDMINIYLAMCETCQKKDLVKKEWYQSLSCIQNIIADVKLILSTCKQNLINSTSSFSTTRII